MGNTGMGGTVSTHAATSENAARSGPGGLAGWLLERLRRSAQPRPRLALLEKISLAPRQSLSLIEAEGRRFLVASSTDGSPAFYPLDAVSGLYGHSPKRPVNPSKVSQPRVSW
jgi:hypothetical protein